MHLFKDAFLVFYPAFNHHLEYEETGMELGKTPLPFLKRLVQLCDESDIDDIHERDRIVFKFLLRHPDQWIRGHILELHSPIISDLTCLVEAHEKQILVDDVKVEDVISDTLPERLACGKPMTIHLKSSEITLTKVLTARKVPLHWEGLARHVIDKALADGIIMKVDGPTDWIYLAFFMDKWVPSETSLHLVTDFTGLNKYVLQPVHPFPSSQEIVSGLNPRLRFFCKMDVIHGYHQIPLDEDSSLLKLDNGEVTLNLTCSRK